MLDARFQDRVLMTEAGRGTAELTFELGEVVATAVAQLDPLEVAPDPLDGIHVGCVGGQGFEMEALGSTRGQEVLDDAAAVDRCAVPDDQEFAREAMQQMLQEPHNVRPCEGAGQDALEHPSVLGQAADCREVIPGQGDDQDGGLPFGGVGPDAPGQEGEARFVDPDDRSALAPGFFSRAGQRAVSQVSTLAGSRWVAWTSGRWTLKPSVRTR